MFSSQYPMHFGVCFSTDTLVYSSILPFTECVPLFSTRSTLRAASVAAQASISSASSSSAVCSSSYFCISADIRRHLAEPQSQGRGWSVRKRNKENQNKYLPNNIAWKCVQTIFVTLCTCIFLLLLSQHDWRIIILVSINHVNWKGM